MTSQRLSKVGLFHLVVADTFENFGSAGYVEESILSYSNPIQILSLFQHRHILSFFQHLPMSVDLASVDLASA